MKRNLGRIVSLALVAIMLLTVTSCTQVINVRFVDSEGNDIDFASVAASMNGGAAGADYSPAAADLTPATQAPVVTNAPVADTAPAVNTTASAAKSTTAPTASTTASGAAPAAAAASNSGMPQSKEQILAFYKSAVAKVKGGAAGYEKKAWQKVPDLKLFGVAAADDAMKGLIGNYMVTEEAAKVEHNEKGTEDAIKRMPDCTLTDMSKIKNATCTMDGSNYAITIVLVDETSPATKQSSFLGQITDNFLAKDDIDNEIANISVLKDVSYDLIYQDYTISATISPDGQFVKMLHHSSVQVKINSATILSVFKLNDKSATLDADCSFNNFTY